MYKYITTKLFYILLAPEDCPADPGHGMLPPPHPENYVISFIQDWAS